MLRNRSARDRNCPLPWVGWNSSTVSGQVWDSSTVSGQVWNRSSTVSGQVWNRSSTV